MSGSVMTKSFRALLTAGIIAVCACALLGLAGCASSASSSSSSKAATTYTEVDADAVANRASSVFLVDVRTADEFDAGHIPGAIRIEYSSTYDKDATLAAAMVDEYKDAGINPDSAVILYCRTGKRAASTAQILIDNGYTNVSVYTGSWTEWSADSSRPVEQ